MPRKKEPELIVEKSPVIKHQWHLTAPKGYKFRLYSYGQYGLTLILEKLKKDDEILDDLNEVVDGAKR